MERRTLRISAAVLAVAAGAFAASPGFAGSRAGEGVGQRQAAQSAGVAFLPTLGTQILVEINRVRATYGLSRLRFARGLFTAAGIHSREMAIEGLFAHESPDGSNFSERLRRYYGSRGYLRWSVGENILWWSPDVSAADAVDAWLRSPPHREIMLDPTFRELGVSAVHAQAAPGDFEGLESTIVTADFGVRVR